MTDNDRTKERLGLITNMLKRTKFIGDETTIKELNALIQRIQTHIVDVTQLYDIYKELEK
jgi:hypothetical protein